MSSGAGDTRQPQSDASRVILVGDDLDKIGHATRAFEAFATDQGLGVELVRRVGVILDELLNNILSHGRPRGQLAVELRMLRTQGRLELQVTDNGIPFNPLEHATPDTAASLEERQPGGLGIHLVRSLMDEVCYQHDAGRNVLRLALRLDSGPGPG